MAAARGHLCGSSVADGAVLHGCGFFDFDKEAVTREEPVHPFYWSSDSSFSFL
jgi:hypothetical protein